MFGHASTNRRAVLAAVLACIGFLNRPSHSFDISIACIVSYCQMFALRHVSGTGSVDHWTMRSFCLWRVVRLESSLMLECPRIRPFEVGSRFKVHSVGVSAAFDVCHKPKSSRECLLTSKRETSSTLTLLPRLVFCIYYNLW